MLLTYKFRIYPSGKQKKRLFYSFSLCKRLYNELLAISRDSYNFAGISLARRDYYCYAKEYSGDIHSQVLQNVGDRLDKSLKNFYRRIKDKKCRKKGFPRFKSRVSSITYPQSGFKLLSDKKLYLSKIGNVPIKLHRIPKGRLKTLTIKQNKAGQWFACFSCEQAKASLEKQHKQFNEIGIDVGIESFAALSNGILVPNPRFLAKSERKIKKLQRNLSRKKKGSKNRFKAKLKLARQHIKTANQRNDFLHKLSRNIADNYSLIKVEGLNIKNMVQNHHLAKHISDASWSSFIQMLSYKVVTSGGKLMKVNPRKTSKICSSCGNEMELPLKKRMFKCNSCGFSCNRDINASINILNGTAGLAETYKPVEIMSDFLKRKQ